MLISMSLDFAAYNFLLFITIVQLELQICPREMRDKLQRLGKTVAVCASDDNVREISMVPCCDGESVSASDRITKGPEYSQRFLRHCVSCGRQ